MLRALAITGHILIAIFAVSIGLAVLGVAESDFERVVTAVLVLIYANVVAWATWFQYLIGATDTASLHRFAVLLRATDREAAESYTSEAARQEEERDKAFVVRW